MKCHGFGRKSKMSNYVENTLEKLGKVKSEGDFKKFLENEINKWNLNVEYLDGFFYEQRNYAIFTISGFNNRGLKDWSLDNLESTLNASKDELSILYEVHEFYQILKEKPNDFYEQYEKIIQDILNELDDEIFRREVNGDYE